MTMYSCITLLFRASFTPLPKLYLELCASPFPSAQQTRLELWEEKRERTVVKSEGPVYT